MVIGPFLPTQLGNHAVSEPHPDLFLLFSNPSNQYIPIDNSVSEYNKGPSPWQVI